MLTTVACSGRDPVADGADNTAGLPAINEPAPDATGTRPTNAAQETNASDLPPTAAKIPAAFRAVGGWPGGLHLHAR